MWSNKFLIYKIKFCSTFVSTWIFSCAWKCHVTELNTLVPQMVVDAISCWLQSHQCQIMAIISSVIKKCYLCWLMDASFMHDVSQLIGYVTKLVNEYLCQSGLTPLHLVAQEDKVNVSEVLVNHGATIDPETKVMTSHHKMGFHILWGNSMCKMVFI